MNLIIAMKGNSQIHKMTDQSKAFVIDLYDFYSFLDKLTALYQEGGIKDVISFVDSTFVPGNVFWFSNEPNEGKFLIYDRAIIPIDENSNPIDAEPILPLSKEMDPRKVITVFKKRDFKPNCQIEVYSSKVN